MLYINNEYRNGSTTNDTCLHVFVCTLVNTLYFHRRMLRSVAGRRPSPCPLPCSLPLCSSHWSSTTGSKPALTHQSGSSKGSRSKDEKKSMKNIETPSS